MRIIGLDIGTTSLSGIICDADSGEILRTVTYANDTFLPVAQKWEKLQDPIRIISHLREMIKDLLKAGNVAAIGITGQMHGIVYLDKSGQPVSPLTTWQDGRGDQPYQHGKTYVEYLSEVTGYSLATGYGAVTHFYNSVNGLIPKSAVNFCTIHDLAVMALTGQTQPLLNSSDAASFGLYDFKNDCFDLAAIRAIGMDPEFFPPVASGFISAGLTPEGIPVSVAIGDNQASVLGSVNDLDHSMLINVGTGSQISCVVSAPSSDTDIDCRPLIPGRWLLTGSSLCGGRAYAILEEFLRQTAALVTEQPVENAYPAMDKLMEEFVPSGQPLIVDTAFSGTRSQPERRGKIENISIDNLNMANLCDGVMNGMVAELHTMYEKMKPLLKLSPTRLIGSGNGLRFNKPLAQRFSNAFGLPLSIPSHREEAAYGAALFAMVATGIVSSVDEAQTRIQYC
ncbi:MAG: FGGY family carbohydrate kinase [Oscillospiraceae bacterium]|nr:FGGY family carbohydrate kinase [Oscillospiraceae bacterium]